MQLRAARREDFPHVYKRIQKLWNYNVYDEEQTRQVYERAIEDTQTRIYLLIDDQDHCHGFYHANFFDSFWMCGKTCYLSGLYVDEADRGKGYGKAAMAHLKQLCREEQCQGIILESGLSRQGAHRFYEGQDFEKSCYGFECILNQEG